VVLVAGLVLLAAAAPPRLAAAQQLTVSGFPGVIGNNIKKSFVETYDRSSTVRYLESWDSARFTQMQANRAKPKEDVVTFTDLTLPLAGAAGLLEVLDDKAIPALREVDPYVRSQSNVGVAFTYGCFGIAYNSKHVTRPITSWTDLLRSDLKGHVSAPNVTYTGAFNTLDALSRTKGKSLLAPEEGMAMYRAIRTSGPGLWDQESVAVGGLKTGEIWATPYFSGNVLAMMADPELKDLRFVVPSEGAYYVPLTVAKVKNGPAGGDGADRFINNMLVVANQEKAATLGKTRPVNVKAKVPDDVAASCPQADKLNRVDVEYLNKNREKIVNQWNEIVNR
jgi:putative spermidine/putrescine transport system substrate-binding protein